MEDFIDFGRYDSQWSDFMVAVEFLKKIIKSITISPADGMHEWTWEYVIEVLLSMMFSVSSKNLRFWFGSLLKLEY